MIAIRRFALLMSVLLPGPAAAQTPNPFVVSAEELLHDWRTGANQDAAFQSFLECPAVSPRNDSIFTGVIAMRYDHDTVMRMALEWTPAQQRCDDPRLTRWYLDRLDDAATGHTARDPDVKGLTFVIVEALEQDGGFGSGAQWPPVVTGPVVIDTARLRDVYEFSYGAAVADSIIHELALAGYALGDFTSLRRSRVNSSGITEHWLDGDPLLVFFDALSGGGDRIDALVAYFYNYQDHLCVRRFEVDLQYTGSQWQILDRKLVMQC